MKPLLYWLLLLASFKAFGIDTDQQLDLIIKLYGLSSSPASCQPKPLSSEKAPLLEAGEILFNSSILSGDNDSSCSVCHLNDKHLTDGLPIAAGIGRDTAHDNSITSSTVLVPRNAFTLFGRNSSEFNTFFWDGKVLERDGEIYSPIGNGYKLGFESALAVAAILPLLARDEFLGKQSYFDSTAHFDSINEQYYDSKFQAANGVISNILANQDDANINALKAAFTKAEIYSPTLADVGNALASFIGKLNDACPISSWESYIQGNTDALSEEQKRGAIIFFGKGRCSGCHTTNLFSDFQYHSLGVPQGQFGPYIHSQDVGRAGVTYLPEDRYKFRTPPLIGVSLTAPYGHNGMFAGLRDIVQFHINPIPFLSTYQWSGERERLTYGKLLSSRSPMLGYITIESEEELDALIAYLEAL